MGTRCSKMEPAHGPTPDPVATSTILRNSGAMRSTPKDGAPRTQIVDGGSVMRELVQSPAFETTSENPFSFGTGMVAKPCQSLSGWTASRTELPGNVVVCIK